MNKHNSHSTVGKQLAPQSTGPKLRFGDLMALPSFFSSFGPKMSIVETYITWQLTPKEGKWINSTYSKILG